MSTLHGKVAIITGASSGIGAATAKKLASEGATVILAARREERLKELQDEINEAGGSAVIKVTDITSKQMVDELVNFTLKSYGKVDIFFNNAGIMPLSFMAKGKTEEWETMVDVNIKGVLYGIGAVLPHMTENNSGHIITTASVAAHNVFPSGTVYCATKFAVRVIMEGLAKELKDTDIRFTTISPGVVTTELPNLITDDEVKPIFENPNLPALNSEDVANSVYYAVSQPTNVAINEIIIRPTHQG